MTGLPYVAAATAGMVHAVSHLGGSSEGEAPDVESALTAVIGALGTAEPGSSEYLSPTCPHENPLMEPAHEAVMSTVAHLVKWDYLQPLRTLAESTIGAGFFLYVANVACCPVSKGILTAVGWEISEVENPGGHPGYRIERNGVVLP